MLTTGVNETSPDYLVHRLPPVWRSHWASTSRTERRSCWGLRHVTQNQERAPAGSQAFAQAGGSTHAPVRAEGHCQHAENNGVVADGHWSRPSISSPYQFISARGGALTLAPGPTWIELVPNRLRRARSNLGPSELWPNSLNGTNGSYSEPAGSGQVVVTLGLISEQGPQRSLSMTAGGSGRGWDVRSW